VSYHGKKISCLPVSQLSKEGRVISVNRLRYIGAVEVQQMLTLGLVEFVIAEIGKPLFWINCDDASMFFNQRIAKHIVEDPDDGFYLPDFPGGLALVASEWQQESVVKLILFESHH
jgi:hypothetical protein